MERIEVSMNTFASDAARRLRRLPPRAATQVLVGPALVYGDDDKLCVIIVRGTPGGEHRKISIEMGRHIPDPLDDPICAFFDTVLHAKRAGELTMREGRALRAALVGELGRPGVRVVDCATERDLMDAYERDFPGEQARKLRAAFDAEQMA